MARTPSDPGGQIRPTPRRTRVISTYPYNQDYFAILSSGPGNVMHYSRRLGYGSHPLPHPRGVMLPLTRMLGSSKECLARSMASLVTEVSPFDWISSTAICGRGQDGTGLAMQAAAGFQTPGSRSWAGGTFPTQPLPLQALTSSAHIPKEKMSTAVPSAISEKPTASHGTGMPKMTKPVTPPEGARSHLRTPVGRSAGSAGLPALYGPGCAAQAEGLQVGREVHAQEGAQTGAKGVVQSWLPASKRSGLDEVAQDTVLRPGEG